VIDCQSESRGKGLGPRQRQMTIERDVMLRRPLHGEAVAGSAGYSTADHIKSPASMSASITAMNCIGTHTAKRVSRALPTQPRAFLPAHRTRPKRWSRTSDHAPTCRRLLGPAALHPPKHSASMRSGGQTSRRFSSSSTPRLSYYRVYNCVRIKSTICASRRSSPSHNSSISRPPVCILPMAETNLGPRILSS
jgi:hypothetical protein